MRRSATERRRLLGLRRGVHIAMVSSSPTTRPPDGIDRAIASDDAARDEERFIGDVCDALYPETKAWR